MKTFEFLTDAEPKDNFIWDSSNKKVYGRRQIRSYNVDSSADICYICKRFISSNNYNVKKHCCESRTFKYLYRVSA